MGCMNSSVTDRDVVPDHPDFNPVDPNFVFSKRIGVGNTKVFETLRRSDNAKFAYKKIKHTIPNCVTIYQRELEILRKLKEVKNTQKFSFFNLLMCKCNRCFVFEISRICATNNKKQNMFGFQLVTD